MRKAKPGGDKKENHARPSAPWHPLSRAKEQLSVTNTFDSDGMDQEWYAGVWPGFNRAVDLTPRVRRDYMASPACGRSLAVHTLSSHSYAPEQWTEELALRFRSDLCSWTNGQYGSNERTTVAQNERNIGPTHTGTWSCPLSTSQLNRFFSDLTRQPHCIHGEPARRIRLDFVPGEVVYCT